MPEIISPLFALQAEDRLKVHPNVHIRAWKICKGRPWKCQLKEREMQKEERSLEVCDIKYYCGRMHWPSTNSFQNLKHKEQTKRQEHFTWSLNVHNSLDMRFKKQSEAIMMWDNCLSSELSGTKGITVNLMLCRLPVLRRHKHQKSKIFFPHFLSIQLVLGRRPHQGKVPCTSGLSTGFTV